MKAYLKTLCGCTRMVEIGHAEPTINIPLKNDNHVSILPELNPTTNTVFPHRVFVLMDHAIFLGETIPIYVERYKNG